jgi:hypothetical protein
MTNEWKWLDGDIGRLKEFEYRGEQVIVELAPIYLGRGSYSDEWYMRLYALSKFQLEDFDGGENLLTHSMPIDVLYIVNENGDDCPDSDDLDKKTNYILEHLNVCSTCDKFFYEPMPESWQVTETHKFCSRNHHDMWEVAHE